MIHPNFTFYHFLMIVVMLVGAIVMASKVFHKPFRFRWWAVIAAVVITLLGAFYTEKGVSGTYDVARYGFPRPIFEINRIIPAFEKDAVVRVHSRMHWDYFFQNFILAFLLSELILKIIKK